MRNGLHRADAALALTLALLVGADHIVAYYGHGTIDCGAGTDTARVRRNHAYRLRGCERIRHF